MSNTADIRRSILEALAFMGEDGMTLASLANELDCGQACLRPILAELGNTMVIRSTQAGRNVRYWIPSAESLLAEEQARQIRVVQPLKIDKARAELYARLAEERGAIASIG